jgi:hypothetical protein
MGLVNDTNGCGRFDEELLPPRMAGGECVDPAAAAHAAGCPSCAALLATRREVAESIRELPRLAVPAAARSASGALTFAAILDRLDEPALDARLRAEESILRRLLRPLGRLRAPASLRLPGSSPLRRDHRRIGRRVAAALAASLLAAAALFVARTGAERGLAGQTAALSDRAPIGVRIVRLDQSFATLHPTALPPRGGP